MIKIKNIPHWNINYKYEATLIDTDFQSIMNGFKYDCNKYFATYGRTANSARNKMIKEIKKVMKITKKFNETEVK